MNGYGWKFVILRHVNVAISKYFLKFEKWPTFLVEYFYFDTLMHMGYYYDVFSALNRAKCISLSGISKKFRNG